MRANERAVAARIAIHAHPKVDQVLGRGAIVDVEYSRIGLTRNAKEIYRGNGLSQIIPDLIFHSRGDVGGNYLVVELKLGYRRHLRADVPDREDLVKVQYLTSADEMGRLPVPMQPYLVGACLDVRPNEAIAHWIHDGQRCRTERLPFADGRLAGGPVVDVDDKEHLHCNW